MTKTSRKTLRPVAPRRHGKKAPARTDHPAGCRISDAERSAVLEDIKHIETASGHAPSLGSYTKHALLSHPRYRRMEVQLRKLLADPGMSQMLERLDAETLTRSVLDAFDNVHSDNGTHARVLTVIKELTDTVIKTAGDFYREANLLLESR